MACVLALLAIGKCGVSCTLLDPRAHGAQALYFLAGQTSARLLVHDGYLPHELVNELIQDGWTISRIPLSHPSSPPQPGSEGSTLSSTPYPAAFFSGSRGEGLTEAHGVWEFLPRYLDLVSTHVPPTVFPTLDRLDASHILLTGEGWRRHLRTGPRDEIHLHLPINSPCSITFGLAQALITGAHLVLYPPASPMLTPSPSSWSPIPGIMEGWLMEFARTLSRRRVLSLYRPLEQDRLAGEKVTLFGSTYCCHLSASRSSHCRARIMRLWQCLAQVTLFLPTAFYHALSLVLWRVRRLFLSIRPLSMIPSGHGWGRMGQMTM